MTSKPETIAQLRRKIERLEAQLAERDAFFARNHDANRHYMVRMVDAEIRIKQAVRILSGEDEL